MKKRLLLLAFLISLIATNLYLDRPFVFSPNAVVHIESEAQFLRVVKAIQKKYSDNNYNGLFPVFDDSRNSAETGAKAPDHSTTNTQISGVDEADIIKTNGLYIYQLTSNHLKIIKSFPINEASVVNKISLDESENGYFYQMFLDDDYLVLLGNRWDYDSGTNGPGYRSEGIRMPFWGRSFQVINVYHLENPEKPKLVKSFEIEGYGLAARKIDNKVVLVTNKGNWGWYRTDGMEGTSLLPSYKIDEEEKVVDPVGVSIIGDPQSLDMLTITTLALGSKINIEMETMMGSGNQVMATREHIYIAKEIYPEYNPTAPASASTEIYKFKLFPKPVLVASGQVAGTLINQFAMDEFEGRLRVATTTFKWWPDGKSETSNNVFVLNSKLQSIGKINNIAKDERIYSVRFTQDRAYMVTFEQIDPFFVIDLSQPTNPVILGELKIPGFSTYLHKIKDNLVLGFGKDVKVTQNGLVQGSVKVSLFDVSNELKPLEVDVLMIGSEYSYAEILYNHTALMVYQPKNLFAFTISDYQDSVVSSDQKYTYINQAVVFSVNEDNELVKHVLYHQPTAKGDEGDFTIQRIIYIDGYLLFVSDSMISIMDSETFEVVRTVR